jgi:hypothetical protein
MQFKTSALLISNTALGVRSDFQLKNRGSGFNIKQMSMQFKTSALLISNAAGGEGLTLAEKQR